MRVLLLNQVFTPDVAATAQHAHDLATHLVRNGHEVHVIASRAIYGEKGGTLPKYELIEGVHVHRVGRSLFGKSSIIARVADFGFFYLLAALKALRIPKPDVTVCFTTPPFIALFGVVLRTMRGSKFVYWVMDLYPDLPVACDVMKPSSPITWLFERINRFSLKHADRTVVLGRCMLQRVRDKGVTGNHVLHIGVWSDEAEVRPVPQAENPYRKEWNLHDKFVVMYSGNFGLGHDVDTMCNAAKELQPDDRIRFVFVGGGKKKKRVEDFVRDNKLKNCIIAPYQPREKLHLSLSAADLHLASLTEGIEGIMVPCKLFGIMAAERPAVFIGHPASELARVLDEHEAGATVRQGDVASLVTIIRRFADNPEQTKRLGRNARAALSAAYNRHDACERWRHLLEDVAAAPTSPSNNVARGDARIITNSPPDTAAASRTEAITNEPSR